jgi:hypothetical protein
MYDKIEIMKMVVQLHKFLGLMLDGWGLSFTALVAFSTGKNTGYQSHRKLGGPKNLYGPFGEQTSLSLEDKKAWFSTLPTSGLITLLNELF